MIYQNRALTFAAAFVVVLGEVGVWWITGLWRISRGLLQSTFEAYAVIFFSALLLATFGSCYLRGARRMLAQAIRGLTSGFALSVVASIVATLLLPDGPQRLGNSIHMVGLSPFLFGQLLHSAMLGGWLFGGVAFCLGPRFATSLMRP